MTSVKNKVKKWNNRYPIGTKVVYRSYPDSPGFDTLTKCKAFVLSGHTACVFVEGVSGCASLDALEPRKDDDYPPMTAAEADAAYDAAPADPISEAEIDELVKRVMEAEPRKEVS